MKTDWTVYHGILVKLMTFDRRDGDGAAVNWRQHRDIFTEQELKILSACENEARYVEL